MHREVITAPPGYLVDHVNGNGLDNRRSNLRLATMLQNNRNRRKCRGRSKFKGVVWHRRNRKWQAQIKVLNKCVYLGQFSSQLMAAQAYDKAAIAFFGKFARLNFARVKGAQK